MDGKVVRIVQNKGFFFVRAVGEREDRFAHATGLLNITFDQLRHDDEVSFTPEASDRGPRASSVFVKRIGMTPLRNALDELFPNE